MKYIVPATKTAAATYKSKLARRALKLWFELGKISKPPVCEVCGAENGALNEGGQKQWLNGHHIEEKKNYALRFDPVNHVLLCPTCHKWGVDSAHFAPVWFIDWLQKNRPEQFEYVLRQRRARPSSLKEWTYGDLETVVRRLEAAITKWKETHK